MGDDVGEPVLGVDVFEARGRDHRHQDRGAVGAALAAEQKRIAKTQAVL
jgi:hypothetical protein